MVAKQFIIEIKRKFGIFACSISGVVLAMIARVSIDFFDGYSSIDTQRLLILCSALFLTIAFMLIGINFIASQKKYKKYENMFNKNEILNVSEIADALEISEIDVMEELSLLLKATDRKKLNVNTIITFQKM